MKPPVYFLLPLLSQFCVAQSNTLETVIVEGRQSNLIGKAISASEGVIGSKEIALRPLLRTGEILELVPGMVVTQHSGSGKANQYFLRGFNLDHGTDFANFVDGMPLNMRSHGHGQGYTDMNFVIPETIASVSYKKGAYYADVGDFSGAGSAQISTLSRFDDNRIALGAGKDNYQRFLLMNNIEHADGNTVLALESNRYDGPWSGVKEDLDKKNLFLKHSQQFGDAQFSVALMAYDNEWNSADQIPARAVGQGLISELGTIDDRLGGQSSRYSVNIQWQQGGLNASAYVIDYDLNLWSNFTYFLDDQNLGDQFEQVDDRKLYGGQLSYLTQHNWAGLDVSNRWGADVRVDDIAEVGLYHTLKQQRVGTKRRDQVEERTLGLFWENRIAWTDNLRTVIGLRHDYLDFDVQDRAGINQSGIDLGVNSGSGNDDISSLKGSVIYNLSEQWEIYASAGQGFHSNDVRGATISIDPSDGQPIDKVNPFVRSFGYEAGLRAFFSERLNASVALWSLELDSELLFVGDAGNTEASRASERQGIELSAYYHFNSNWSVDLEYAYTDAEFSDYAPEGNNIPGALEQVLQAGINADFADGWFGSLRLRHFGERPLVEDASVNSDSSTVLNLRVGLRAKNWAVYADVLNLSDSDAHDVDYFYESRLAGEAAGVEDIHYHVIEPRTARLTLQYQY